MAQPTYPGVYIEEFAPAPPIQPAGTRVGAFVGAAATGEILTPTRITSFNQFLDTYGRRPLNGFFLWYAVKGFFENGGSDCFVVRASNGRYAQDVLLNGSDKPVLKVRTREPGKPEPGIAVSTLRTSRLSPTQTRLFVAEATATGPPGSDRFLSLTRADGNPGAAFLFRPGDVIQTASGARATIRQVDAKEDRIKLDRDVPGLGTTDKTIALAPIQPNDSTFRIEYLKAENGALATGADGEPVDESLPPDALVPGTMLTLRPDDESQKITGVVDAVENEFLFVAGRDGAPPRKKVTYRVTLRDNVGRTITRDGDRPVQSEEFDLTVKVEGQGAKVYNFLAMDPVHPRYAPKYVSARGSESDALIKLEATDPPPPGDPSSLLPKNDGITLGAAPEEAGRSPGKVEGLKDLFSQPNEFIAALDALKTVNEVNLVSVPDAVALDGVTNRIAVQQAVISHCENLGDRFGVLDPRAPDQDPFKGEGDDASIEVQRGQLVSTRGYVALYYPWVRVLPASRGPLVAVPPSGHVCGLMARVDNTRGVHKAPANETLDGAVEIMKDMSNEDQGILNMQGINVIRTFTQKGRPIVFGARTTASNLSWQYVNVRRLFLFLEKSISNSLRASVFEPNNTDLWEKLRRTITAFLVEQWHAGALFGRKAEQAFYVKIDEVLNPFNERSLGKLTIEIGVQPTYPAEFIIVRIGIWDGGAEIQE